MRLGGLLLRLESCREVNLDYLGGKTDKIEELEAPVLPLIEGFGKNLYPLYKRS